jgi:hypothetical protein
MQINIENAFNSIFWVIIFKKLCDAKGLLLNIAVFIKLFYVIHFSLCYQCGWHFEGVIIIESSLGTKQGDSLGGPLFVLAHYRTFLETIAQAPNCIFPFLMDNIHIIRPLNEIICAFDHLQPN